MTIIVPSIIVLLTIWLLTTSIIIVKGKTAAILETFGKPHKTGKRPGLRFKLPWPITSVVARINLQIQEVSKDVSVKTADNSFMSLPVKVQYRASDDPAGSVKAHYELEDPETQIVSYVLNNVRQSAADIDMIDLYKNRSNIEDQVQESLSERFERFGYIIENVLVDEPQPSHEVEQAFNEVIASIRKKEAAENLAAAKRIELVGIAEAEAESKKLQGQGIADMRDAIAKGLKESLQLIEEAGLTKDQAVELLMHTNRLDTLSTAANHGNMVIVDINNDKTEHFGSTVAAMTAAKNMNT